MTEKDFKIITDLNKEIVIREEKQKELNKMLKRNQQDGGTGIKSIQIIAYDRVYKMGIETDLDKEILDFIDNSLLEYKEKFELEIENLKKQFNNIQVKMINIEGEPHE